MKELPPLSPELEALLAPHRNVLPLAPSAEARVLARAAASAAESAAWTFRPRGRPLSWGLVAACAAVAAISAAAYAAHAWRGWPASPSQARVVPIVPPRATEPRPPVVVAVERETEAPATTVLPTPPTSRRAVGKVTATSARSRNAELAVLRLAREDLTRGDFAGALAAVAEHARRFRNGILVEEREALRVKSLAGLGRQEDARRAAAEFHSRFPHSVLLSTFERMREPDR